MIFSLVYSKPEGVANKGLITNNGKVASIDDKKLRQLIKINPDVLGILRFDNTDIDYPIVQGRDNEYYLKHDYTGEYNYKGAIFLDANNNADLSDRNNIVYGHNMADGSMFGHLKKYIIDDKYALEHNAFTINTINNEIRCKIFSAYIVDVKADNSPYKIFKHITNNSDLVEWARECLSKTKQKNFDADFGKDAKIWTFSTCYDNFDKRIIIQGLVTNEKDEKDKKEKKK